MATDDEVRATRDAKLDALHEQLTGAVWRRRTLKDCPAGGHAIASGDGEPEKSHLASRVRPTSDVGNLRRCGLMSTALV
jgi:hypothetical protein